MLNESEFKEAWAGKGFIGSADEFHELRGKILDESGEAERRSI